MLRDQMYSGLIAVGLGGLVCVVLFVPYVAFLYRRRGRPTAIALATGVAAVIYGWAIWTFTLLPLPQGPIPVCAGVNLDPGTFVDEFLAASERGGNLMLDPAILQFAFNVLLFVPLGVFVRVLFGRGIVVATLLGLLVSLGVEFTQLTGVWGLYECAYRVFDVTDLITNTAGAVIGSIISLLVPRAWHLNRTKQDADDPRPVTRRRRILAMLCDALAYGLLLSGLTITARVVAAAALGTPAMLEWATVIDITATVVTLAVFLVQILTTGQSIGDAAVRLRYVGGTLPEALARLMRFLGGIAGISLVAELPPFGSFVSFAAVIATVVLTFVTADGRGLPGLLSGRRLVDSRGHVEAE